MSFYGKPNNITETHFQFDKIYPSRQAMDAELINGQDNIFTGRFVLVNYNDADLLSLPNVQIGYKFIISGETKFYQDSSGQYPFEYTDFTSFAAAGVADPPAANVLQNYYFKKDNYFFRMPTDVQYYSSANRAYYYIPSNTESTALVGEGWIVREFYNGLFTGNFYRCTGQDAETDEPVWSYIGNSDEYVFSYLINYQNDRETYGEAFDTRGYNATIWQKVYSEGVGRFVLIARLECSPPWITLTADPPSMDPAAPYLDATSTDQIYKIHVPSNWGLQIKPIATSVSDDEEEESEIDYNKSDQIVSNTSGTPYNADIYMNLGGNYRDAQVIYHQNASHRDTSTQNEILLTPTGKSGRTYDGEEKEDILELAIHLPIVGNMIDEGYDLIYGVNEDNSRPRDIAWYSGDSSDELKQTGVGAIGGKTYDPSTLAGNINTMHNVLGQIVIERDNLPTEEEVYSLSSEYLYKIDGAYYRLGNIYTPSIIQESEYTYTQQATVTQSDFKTNKYYYLDGSTYRPATGYDSNLENNGYYLKNINGARYTEIDLVSFESGVFYRKEGEDYICDNSPDLPSSLARVYYRDIQTVLKPGPTASDRFIIQYTPGNFYVLDPDDGNYKKTYEDIPDSDLSYSTISATAFNSGNRSYFYRPNCFYAKSGDSDYFLATDATANPYYTYYVCTFDMDHPQYGLVNGEIATYFPVVGEPEEVTFTNLRGQDINQLYIKDPNNAVDIYIPYANIENLGIIDGKNPYTLPYVYYTLNIVSYSSSELYLPGVYYYKDENNSYIKDYNGLTQNRQYYSIVSATEVTDPFYYPDMYWYESSTDIYQKDLNVHKTTGRTYYTKASLYVYQDEENLCPYGYEWNDLAAYIPPSITLCEFEKTRNLVLLSEIGENTDSLYGLILHLNRLYDVQNEASRDLTTIRGMYNSLRDAFYQMRTLQPGHILYVNDFGQIESSDITIQQLENLINNS